MRIRKRIAMVAILLLASLCACNQKKEVEQQENVGPYMALSLTEIENFETLCQWSNTIVKAKYVGTPEQFNSSTNIFFV